MEVSPARNTRVLISISKSMMRAADDISKMISSKSIHEDFVKQYIDARKKEHRLYTNKQVIQLPDVPASHELYKEWQVRKTSAEMIVHYLRKKKKALKILEVGCGNGWLSAAMAKVKNSNVTGIDINDIELSQAKEVFQHIPNVRFICTDIDEPVLKQQPFDIIVFAASIQYFESVNHVIKTALSLLSRSGEIHIIDTHFYKTTEIEEAKKRTGEYYNALGFPGMSKHYYHHSLTDFSSFNFSILFAPSLWQKILFGNPHPFYRIKIKGKG